MWNDENRFHCPHKGEELVMPQERDYRNLFLFLEDLQKYEGCL